MLDLSIVRVGDMGGKAKHMPLKLGGRRKKCQCVRIRTRNWHKLRRDIAKEKGKQGGKEV